MKIISKDFCTFTGVCLAIYMGPCRRPYILPVQKFRTSEMLDKWSPISKLSDIKLPHYPDGQYILFTCTRTRLSTILIKPVFWFFKSFPCLLWLNFEYWITYQFWQFRCKSATAYVLHNFSNVLTWVSLTEFLRGFFVLYFLLGLRKKDTEKTACKKFSSKLSQKYPSI